MRHPVQSAGTLFTLIGATLSPQAAAMQPFYQGYASPQAPYYQTRRHRAPVLAYAQPRLPYGYRNTLRRPAAQPRTRMPTAPQARKPAAPTTAKPARSASPAAERIEVKQSGALSKATVKPSANKGQASRQDFLNKVERIVVGENNRLALLRAATLKLFGRLDELGVTERKRLRTLAKKYRVDGNPLESPAARTELTAKLDVIPLSLALAQAANESAWGTSRFAREGNNLFGIWTYDESRGMVPKQRSEGKKHLVRKFDSLEESVRFYLHTLNSHPAYSALRTLRVEQRARGEPLDGLKLAAGLTRYSAKGEEYVRLIRGLIKRHKLARRGAQRGLKPNSTHAT